MALYTASPSDSAAASDAVATQGVYARKPISTQNAVDPSTLSGVAYRFRADDLTGADGSQVGTWPDTSGNSRDAAQATGSKQPILVRNAASGHAVVRFDGADDVMTAPISGSYPEYETTIFVVGKAGTNASTHRFLTRSRAAAPASTDFVTVFQNGATFGATYRDGATRSATGGVALDMTLYHVMSARLSDSGGLVTADILAEGLGQPGVPSTATTTLGAFDTFAIGALTNNNTTSQFLGGDIAEIIVFDHPLTLAQMRGVEAWLAGVYSTPRAEQVGGSDGIAAQRSVPAAVSDTAAAADSSASQRGTFASVTEDTGPAYDAPARQSVVGRMSADAAAAADTPTRLFTQVRQPSDTAAAADSAARSIAVLRLLSDALSTSDSLTRTVSLSMSVADTTTLSDSVVRQLWANRSPFDSATATDIDFALRWGYLPSLATLTKFDPNAVLDGHDAAAALFGGGAGAAVV